MAAGFDVDIDYGDDAEIRRAFSWLARSGIGLKFGDRPIGWYQMHQIAALDILKEKALAAGASTRVQVSRGDVKAYDSKDRRWVTIGNVNQIYDAADRRARR